MFARFCFLFICVHCVKHTSLLCAHVYGETSTLQQLPVFIIPSFWLSHFETEMPNKMAKPKMKRFLHEFKFTYCKFDIPIAVIIPKSEGVYQTRYLNPELHVYTKKYILQQALA